MLEFGNEKLNSLNVILFVLHSILYSFHLVREILFFMISLELRSECLKLIAVDVNELHHDYRLKF